MSSDGSQAMTFAMAGGGTGGHVIPSIAVARELKQKGHEVFFIGTRTGLEATLVPAAGLSIEWITIGGLMRVGAKQAFTTLFQLPASVWAARRMLKRRNVAAVFSMGGYVAAPVMAAAWWLGIPMVIMEPNAIPGITNRRLGRLARKVLVSFEAARPYFGNHPGVEVTGLPVRREFFEIGQREASEGDRLTVLVTGGSQGSRTLNQACEQAWPALKGSRYRIIHQAGRAQHRAIAERFAASGVEGEVVAFLPDMPKAFASADVVVCRSGAGTVSELAAAGKPSILVPFPFAADDHQTKNAEAMAQAGAARLVADKEMTGERLMEELGRLDGEQLRAMGVAARHLAKQGAAARAADLLIELGGAERGR